MAQSSNKRPITARWGWSGGAIIWPSEGECTSVIGTSQSGDLEKIIAQLVLVNSTCRQIRAELLSMRPSYHRYLRQDEFGPTRAEQLCALRNLRHLAQRSIGILEYLPEAVRSRLFDEVGRVEAFAPVTWFDDKEIRALLVGAKRLVSRRPLHQFDNLGDLQDLIVTLDALTLRIRLLDTNTQAGFLFCKRAGSFGEQAATSIVDLIGVTGPLLSLRTKLQVRIETLEAVRGPDGQRSLSWLVYSLCDLWLRETGRPVDSIGWKNGDFNGPPSSPSAKFVAAVVEVFQPDKEWFENQPVLQKSVLVFTQHRAHRARRIHNLMRSYVRHQDQGAVRRRRPRSS